MKTKIEIEKILAQTVEIAEVNSDLIQELREMNCNEAVE